MTNEEIIGILIILIAVFLVFSVNLRVSIRRARDAQRKSDVRSISDSLNKYQNDFGFFPLSEGGKIVACRGEINSTTGTYEFKACEWAIDSLIDISDPSYLPYLSKIPYDPDKDKGASYYYLSNGKKYQIYAALEGRDEAEYDLKIEARKLSCGIKICNFGLASGALPLDKSIEEYENEMEKKNQEL